jgi:hypothetical protein
MNSSTISEKSGVLFRKSRSHICMSGNEIKRL